MADNLKEFINQTVTVTRTTDAAHTVNTALFTNNATTQAVVRGFRAGNIVENNSTNNLNLSSIALKNGVAEVSSAIKGGTSLQGSELVDVSNSLSLSTSFAAKGTDITYYLAVHGDTLTLARQVSFKTNRAAYPTFKDDLNNLKTAPYDFTEGAGVYANDINAGTLAVIKAGFNSSGNIYSSSIVSSGDILIYKEGVRLYNITAPETVWTDLSTDAGCKGFDVFFSPSDKRFYYYIYHSVTAENTSLFYYDLDSDTFGKETLDGSIVQPASATTINGFYRGCFHNGKIYLTSSQTTGTTTFNFQIIDIATLSITTPSGSSVTSGGSSYWYTTVVKGASNTYYWLNASDNNLVIVVNLSTNAITQITDTSIGTSSLSTTTSCNGLCFSFVEDQLLFLTLPGSTTLGYDMSTFDGTASSYTALSGWATPGEFTDLFTGQLYSLTAMTDTTGLCADVLGHVLTEENSVDIDVHAFGVEVTGV